MKPRMIRACQTDGCESVARFIVITVGPTKGMDLPVYQAHTRVRKWLDVRRSESKMMTAAPYSR
jgi:hypothetical protein